MAEVLKRQRQAKGPTPMGNATHKGTMGSGGGVDPPARGVMGKGSPGSMKAKGVLGKTS
jgi:hypothetical protein